MRFDLTEIAKAAVPAITIGYLIYAVAALLFGVVSRVHEHYEVQFQTCMVVCPSGFLLAAPEGQYKPDGCFCLDGTNSTSPR